MKSSRYARGEEAWQVVLQPRDRCLLLSIHRYRYLRVEHVHALHFASRGRRAVQTRLRKLWRAGFLDRYFFSTVLSDSGPPDPAVLRPVYSLARPGAVVVAGALGIERNKIPHTPRANRRGFETLAHHLAAIDVLVAVEVACRRGGIELVAVEPETVLRRKLALWRKQVGKRREHLVPDGAFTIRFPGQEDPVTFAMEIVRADAKGGNRVLVERLGRYEALIQDGFFQEALGQDRLRAVLVATSSWTRAEHLRRAAHDCLPRGAQRLLWFGEYPSVGAALCDGRVPEILTKLWTTPLDKTRSILPSPPAPQSHPHDHGSNPTTRSPPH